MNPTEYQKAAERTECDQSRSLARITFTPVTSVRLLHAHLGLSGEVGELAGAIEKWIYYGKMLDTENIKEELGDCLWYVAQMCNAIGLDLSEVMAANIRKLKVRFPDKYKDELAAESGRDRTAEQEAVSNKHSYQDGHGFGQAMPCEERDE
jgi:NTP pyrophosphatase (non-canonical NTP hydrolase)